MVKIYSDKTNKFYSSVEEATKAEVALKEAEEKERLLAEKKAAELKAQKAKEAECRKEAAEKVEVARKNMVMAQKAYKEAIEDFCNKYGTYHFSTTGTDFPTLFDLFHTLL